MITNGKDVPSSLGSKAPLKPDALDTTGTVPRLSRAAAPSFFANRSAATLKQANAIARELRAEVEARMTGSTPNSGRSSPENSDGERVQGAGHPRKTSQSP